MYARPDKDKVPARRLGWRGGKTALMRGGKPRHTPHSTCRGASAHRLAWRRAAILGLDTRRRMGEGRIARGDAGGARKWWVRVRHQVPVALVRHPASAGAAPRGL